MFSSANKVTTENEFWAVSAEFSSAKIDHADWQTMLTQYIKRDTNGINRFAYGRVNDDDLDTIESYLEMMQEIDPRKYSRVEQKAYWINLYNALTIQVILDNYPLKSITMIGDEKKGPWDDDIAEVAGKSLTLNMIEHEILRRYWSDARIHFAVNCASVGCPNLQPSAYTSRNTEHLLDTAAKEYLSHPRGVTFENNTLILSSIFDWYGTDFGKTQQERLNTLSQYLPKSQAGKVKNYTGKIKYHYDWSLNE